MLGFKVEIHNKPEKKNDKPITEDKNAEENQDK